MIVAPSYSHPPEALELHHPKHSPQQHLCQLQCPPVHPHYTTHLEFAQRLKINILSDSFLKVLGWEVTWPADIMHYLRDSSY